MASISTIAQLKDTPFRWLPTLLRKLAETLFLPEDDIHRICYFTARLDARSGNPNQPRRHLSHIPESPSDSPWIRRLLWRIPCPGVKRRPLAEPVPGLPSHVLVRDSEEKGADVNLATRLLVDGFNGEYEQAVVVSNDADFAGAMQYVKDVLGLRVTLVNPDPRNSSPRELADAATYVKRYLAKQILLRRSKFAIPSRWRTKLAQSYQVVPSRMASRSCTDLGRRLMKPSGNE